MTVMHNLQAAVPRTSAWPARVWLSAVIVSLVWTVQLVLWCAWLGWKLLTWVITVSFGLILLSVPVLGWWILATRRPRRRRGLPRVLRFVRLPL